GLRQHLETVANADDRNAALRSVLDRAHDRRSRRHRPGAQVVAVGKAARHADEIHALGKIAVLVPDHRRLASGRRLERYREVVVDELACADIGHAVKAASMRRVMGGLGLRVYDAGLESDGDARLHGISPRVASLRAMMPTHFTLMKCIVPSALTAAFLLAPV